MGSTEPETSRSWIETAQRELFFGWQRWTSFACIWSWSCLAGMLSLQNDGMRSLLAVLGGTNGITLTACVVGLSVVLAMSRRLEKTIDSRLYLGIAESLAIAGSALIAAGALSHNVILHGAGASAGGIAIGLLKIAWGEMYSRMTLRAGLASMGYSLISSSALVLLVRDIDTIGLCVLLLLCAIPLSPLAFRGARKLSETPEKPKHALRAVRFSASLLALPVLVGFSYGVSKAVVAQLGQGGGNADWAGTISAYASLVAGITTFAFSFMLGRRITAAQIYSTSLVFVVAGLLLIMSQTTSQQLPFFASSVGFSLFYFFMVVYWGDLAYRTGKPIVRIYTIGYLAMQASQLVGVLIASGIDASPLRNGGMIVPLALVLAFFAAALLLFGSSRSPLRQWLVADEETLETNDNVPLACAELSKRGGLSPREQEVLAILARGRNAPYVAKTLCIAPDTAKTHIKSIYRKLDIHTQQDLLDEIDALASRMP